LPSSSAPWRRCIRAASISGLAGRRAAIRTPCGACAAIRGQPRGSLRTCWSCRAI
jgi:hypothetical protein